MSDQPINQSNTRPPATISNEVGPSNEPGIPYVMNVWEPVIQMQGVLSERIERSHERLRATEAAVSNIRAHEAKISELEAELKALRRSAKELEIRSRRLEADNSALRAMQAVNTHRGQNEVAGTGRNERVNEIVGIEVGRVVRALCPAKGGLLWRWRISRQAKRLVDAGIVVPKWYLARHTDVAAAGVDPAVHYVLHGSEEGRLSKAPLTLE